MLQIGIREPGSAITHFIAMMMAIFATSPLLVKAALNGNHTTILAMAVFMGSMVLLYGASTVYHSLVVRDKILKIFRKLDHMMIFVLIAGSYTPVCLIVLGGEVGLYAACGSVGHCGGRNADKSALDQLPEVVFIRDLYRNGMGVSVCIPGTVSHSFPGSIFVAACRRSDLYCRRCDLCIKTAGVQREAQSVWFP
mgnify:CR=1 FL=1